MKFKLDENFGTRTIEIFRAAGHDIHTVCSQELQGCLDHNLYEVCCKEQRCLVFLHSLAFEERWNICSKNANLSGGNTMLQHIF